MELDAVHPSACSYTQPRQEEELTCRLRYMDLNPCSKSGTELDLWSGKRALY